MTFDTAEGIHRPVVLVGFMATGKSKIGRLLAKRLNLPFVDSDEEIETAFGRSIADIFAEHGEAEFRRVERSVICRLIDGTPHLIAIGGGAFMDGGTRELLQASAITIWLDPPFDVIASRLKRSDERPLASSTSDEDLLALWQERRPYYAQAQMRIETSDEDPSLAVERILAELGQR